MKAKLSGAIGSSTTRRDPGGLRAPICVRGAAKARLRTNREGEP